jgi:anti-sigma B factor antagonist
LRGGVEYRTEGRPAGRPGREQRVSDDILAVTSEDAAERVVVLTAVGEIDRDSRLLLEDAAEAALQRGGDRLVIDLSGVTFCDSGGLSLFVRLHREATGRGGSLRLAGARGSVLTVLTVTDLNRLLALHGTADEAVQASRATA